MKSLIVTKEVAVTGYYEEPLYDNAPSYTYTQNVTHKLYPGDICYVYDDGRMWHESNEYGVSIHGAVLWLHPTETEKKSIFGQLTDDMAETWNQLLEKRFEIEDRLNDLRSELYHMQMEFEYQLNDENEDASTEHAWTVLANQTKLEYEYVCLEYRYSGILVSIQLMANMLKAWNYEEELA